ncbi:OmpH family outer membrane protein [Deinococcus sedimenti]|uniref:Cationic outer membrane protein OmpH n=1 Tax=Deinococcus sedimenti TaxID=1867090 RepID=A0ABQ2S3A7_9DEIO|nr:OmpH family outer membrane protein [Deinococcus sedimenti]GGR84157.1 cationic outer membrane protein OmpH [Deinococcus sedimenti]
MKISAKLMAPVALATAFGLGMVAPHAQTTAQKVAFVDISKLLAAHSNAKAINDIKAKADAELGAIDKQIKAIDAKGTNASAAEKQTREALIKTIQAKAADYDKQIDPKVTEIEQAVDKAVSAVAKSNGYGIVMDMNVAARSGLVIYADDSTDLTSAVVKNIK